MIWEIILRDSWGNILCSAKQGSEVNELACFSEVSRQRAFERFGLLRAHLENGRPLAAIAREARLSYRTLQYWLERYRTYGLVGLVHKPRTDRGRRRNFPLPCKRSSKAWRFKNHLFQSGLPVIGLEKWRMEYLAKHGEESLWPYATPND